MSSPKMQCNNAIKQKLITGVTIFSTKKDLTQ